jgi:hypothetical protein
LGRLIALLVLAAREVAQELLGSTGDRWRYPIGVVDWAVDLDGQLEVDQELLARPEFDLRLRPMVAS